MTAVTIERPKIDVAAKIREWRESPSVMVRDLFGVKPSLRQEAALDAFPLVPTLRVTQGTGEGMTALLAWIGWNFMLTRANSRGLVVPGFGSLWVEMAKWRKRSPLLNQFFVQTKNRIYGVENPEQWWLRLMPGEVAREKNASAGLTGDHLLYLIDAREGLPLHALWEAEASLFGCKDGHLVRAFS